MPTRKLILLCLLSYLSSIYCAPLIIATYATTPFIIADTNTSLRGFSVDLWDAITRDIGVEYNFVLMKSIPDLLGAVTNGSVIANASLCSISITPERAAIMDFSQPMLDSGLQIMVYKSVETSNANKTLLILQVLFSRLFWEILGVFFIFIIVFTHIFYALEKKPKGREAAVRGSYLKGGFEDSIWWACSILFTSGSDLMPMTSLGRLLTFIGILASCILVAILQAAITAQLTVSSLQQSGGINKITDLIGLNVGVEAGSTSELYLKTIGGINIILYDNNAAMLAAFSKRANGLSAVFGDFPVFEYYTANEGANIGQIVGPVYQPQQYGIAFPNGSPLRRQVDVAILSLQAQGTYEFLVDKWFSGIQDGTSGDINVLDPDDLTLAVTWGFVAASGIFVIVIMSIRSTQSRLKKYKVKDMQLEPSDSWEAVEKEITEIQEHMQELNERLHKLKSMTLRTKKDITFT